MDLPRWLQKVAAAVNHDLKQLTADVYLETLSKWHLTDQQWELLRERAKTRLPYFYGRLPGISELLELASELHQEQEAQENNRKLREMYREGGEQIR